MIPITSLLIVVTLSILVTRIASTALTHTGLSRESARFQARSAFSGAGFTTNESENVVNHPVRRRIMMLLMLLGNAGIVTAVSALILGFVGKDDAGNLAGKIVLLVSGLMALWMLASSEWVDRKLSRVIDWALRTYTHIDTKDYAQLMRLSGDYRIAEMAVESDDWIAGRRLRDARLRDEGIVVLGNHTAGGDYVGVPRGDHEPRPGDRLVLYARAEALEDLSLRTASKDVDRVATSSTN